MIIDQNNCDYLSQSLKNHFCKKKKKVIYKYCETLSVSEIVGQKFVQHSLMEQRGFCNSSLLTVSIYEETETTRRDLS